jgi:hypothetical protein
MNISEILYCIYSRWIATCQGEVYFAWLVLVHFEVTDMFFAYSRLYTEMPIEEFSQRAHLWTQSWGVP